MAPARNTPHADPKAAHPRVALLYEMLQAGQVLEAEKKARRALRKDPDDVDMLRVLATSLLLQKRMADAIEPLERATDLDPGHGESWIRLGLCRDTLGNIEAAATAYREGLARDPSQPASWINASVNAYRRRAWGESEEFAHRGLEQAPGHPRLRLELGKALREQGRNGEALEVLEALRGEAPRDPYVLEALALTLENLHRVPEALAVRETLFELRPGDRVLRTALHDLLRREGRLDDAERYLDRRAAQGSEVDADDVCFRGEILAARGHTIEAIATWEQALARDPRHIRSARHYIQHRRLAPDSKLAADMQAVLAEDPPTVGIRNRSKAASILAKIHWDQGEHEQAMDLYAKGNHLFRDWAMSQGQAHDAGVFAPQVTAIRTAFTPAALHSVDIPGSGDPRPLFILGMPRSGKSLLESRLVATDVGVAAGGECQDVTRLFCRIQDQRDGHRPAAHTLLDHLHTASPATVQDDVAHYLDDLTRFGAQARYISQTLPSTLLYVGILHWLFPRARFIFCHRDLEDLGLSCYAADFSNAPLVYATDLYYLGREIRACETLMAHWHELLPAGTILDVRYEDLVTEPEATLSRVHEHLELAPPATSRVEEDAGPSAPAFAITAANPGRPRPDFVGIAGPVRHRLEPLHRGYREAS